MSYQISPKELAERVEAKVVEQCREASEIMPIISPYLKCIVNHSPDRILDFVDDNTRQILENAGREFVKSFKKEYKKLWMDDVVGKLSEDLGDDIESMRLSIVENDELNDNEKVYLLKKLKNALEELLNVVDNAVNAQKPLSSGELKEHILKLYKVLGIPYRYPDDPIDYYMDYYDYLNKAKKLELLRLLSDDIDGILYDIDDDLKEYNALEQ